MGSIKTATYSYAWTKCPTKRPSMIKRVNFTGRRRGILPIEPAELGQELWRLDFGEHDVTLQVNKEVPGLVDRARSDPMFYAAVYPSVVRDVLSRAIAENAEIEEEGDHWPILWL